MATLLRWSAPFAFILAGGAGALGACSAEPAVFSSTSGGGEGPGATGTGTNTTGSGGGDVTVGTGSNTTGSNTTTGSGSTSTGSAGGAPPCTAGTILCDGSVKKVCDGNGGFTEETDCAPNACAPGIGCVVCVPGTGTCNGSTSHFCKPDGTGYDDFFCDPDQGVICNPQTGACEGACAAQVLLDSYVGCDYYPTVTAQEVASNPFHFAVAVSNTTAAVASMSRPPRS
jgi:hypothetical protein